MATQSVQHTFVTKQASKDGSSYMELRTNRSFLSLIHTIIRENSKYKYGSYSLHLSQLSEEEKLLMLSYLIHPDDYAYYLSDERLKRAAIKEYEPEMQYFIDEEIDDVFHEDMHEMGLLLKIYNDNGEGYYVKR